MTTDAHRLEDKHKFVKAMEAREVLRAIYLDYLNDYLTPEVYADHNGLSTSDAVQLIGLARIVYNKNHPDA